MDKPVLRIEPQPLEEEAKAVPDYSMLRKERYSSGAVSIERRSASNTVFHVDDSPFQSTTPAATHWSVAWSDLMMTMFILFLSMFVYQAANVEFLGKKTPEILGGDTTGALEFAGERRLR